MTALSRIAAEDQLSVHSSLADEEINLDRERRRKASKIGQHPPESKIGFAGAAYAAKVAGKQRQSKGKRHNVEKGLKIAGKVGIAGAAAHSEEKKPKNDLYSTAVVATTVARVKRYQEKLDTTKTISAALRVAGAVAIAACAWTPAQQLNDLQLENVEGDEPDNTENKPKHTIKGAGHAARAMVTANISYKRRKEYNVAEALRTAGGVAIAGTAWTKNIPDTHETSKERESAKVVHKKQTIKGAGLAARGMVKATATYKRIKEHSVAEALRTAGGVAIAGTAWTKNIPDTHETSKERESAKVVHKKQTIKGAGLAARGMVKANATYKRIKEHSVAEALRTAGGVAIAGVSWTKKISELQEMSPDLTDTQTGSHITVNSSNATPQRVFVDMATSPIPQNEPTPAPRYDGTPTPEPSPSPIPLPDPTPTEVKRKALLAVGAAAAFQSSAPRRTPTPSPVPSVPPKSAGTPTKVKSPTPVIVAQPVKSPSPTPVIVVQPVKSPSPTPVIAVQPVKSPSPTPVIAVQPVKSPTPTPEIAVEPEKSPSPTKTRSPTPQPSIKSPTPTPQSSTQSSQETVIAPPVVVPVVAAPVITNEVRRETVRSRERRPAALLAAGAVIGHHHQTQKRRDPTPRVPSPVEDKSNPVIKHEDPEPPAVQVKPTTPAESDDDEEIEEIPLIQDEAVTVPNLAATAPKPKRKALARLTPLVSSVCLLSATKELKYSNSLVQPTDLFYCK